MKTRIFYSIIVGLFLAQLMTIFWKPKSPALHLRRSYFSELPGWERTDATLSLKAFQISCKAFLKQEPEQAVGSQFIDVKARDWHPACKAAMHLSEPSQRQAQRFFQTWFMPVEFFHKHSVNGLFTGYFMPLLQGSLTKSKHYSIPLYGVPKNMLSVHLHEFSAEFGKRRLTARVKDKKVVPYYTRAEINRGVIAPFTPVVAWVSNQVDRLALEIEGSGVIKLEDGHQMMVGYAGENGAPYTSIPKVLIDQGVLTHDNASMRAIRHYFELHPQRLNSVFNRNKSFVFFHRLPHDFAVGSQGVSLTPGYSLAVDRRWIPMGTPMWLVTQRPTKDLHALERFQRLMIAQDTGGAIRGPVRGDVFWGAGEEATRMAGHMKNQGHYWLLLPRQVAERLTQEA